MIQGLFSLLTSDLTVSGLVGTRVYPLLLPNGATLPAITLQVVGSQTLNAGFNTRGIEQTRLQVDCWGTSYASADSVRSAVTNLLHGFNGELSDGTLVQSCQLLQHIDFYEDEALQYRTAVEFYLWSAI